MSVFSYGAVSRLTDARLLDENSESLSGLVQDVRDLRNSAARALRLSLENGLPYLDDVAEDSAQNLILDSEGGVIRFRVCVRDRVMENRVETLERRLTETVEILNRLTAHAVLDSGAN